MALVCLQPRQGTRPHVASTGSCCSAIGRADLARACTHRHDRKTRAAALPAAAPFALLGSGAVVLASLVAARAYSGAQITYVTAAMLSRSLPKSDLRIVQVGGGVKELYYYPSTTVQVTLCSADVKPGLVNTASIQAGVPTVLRKEGAAALAKLPGVSADAIVVLGGLQDASDLATYFSDVARVLKPGGRFIFIQSVSSGGQSLLQRLAGAAPLELQALESLKQARGFESVQWDVANENVSPHVVGLAMRKQGQLLIEKEGKSAKRARKRANKLQA